MSIIKLKLYKLDKRNNGYNTWKYYVEDKATRSNPESIMLFCRMREWCWTKWGASKELNEYFSNKDLFHGVNCSNSRWCWKSDEYRKRIYLRDEDEAVAFTLKWF